MFPFMIGLTVGLVLAALVALYVTQAPVPFVDRGIQRPQGTASGGASDAPEPLRRPLPTEQVAEDDERPPQKQASPPSASGTPSSATAPPSGAGRAAPAATGSGSPPAGAATGQTPGSSPPASASQFFLQVAAFKSSEEADQMRARLAFMGFEAQISEAKRDNLVLYRVRLGPYRSFEELNRAKTGLSDNGLESTVVRSP